MLLIGKSQSEGRGLLPFIPADGTQPSVQGGGIQAQPGRMHRGCRVVLPRNSCRSKRFGERSVSPRLGPAQACALDTSTRCGWLQCLPCADLWGEACLGADTRVVLVMWVPFTFLRQGLAMQCRLFSNYAAQAVFNSCKSPPATPVQSLQVCTPCPAGSFFLLLLPQ